MADQFRIEPIADPAVVRAFLSVDRARHAYMIGDLSAPYWSPDLFYGAFAPGLRAIVLLYSRFNPPPLISAGEPDAVAALFADLIGRRQLNQVMYHTLPDHLAALQTCFQLREEPIPMWRMGVNRDQFNPIRPRIGTVRRLIGTDAAAVQAVFDSGHDAEFIGDRPHISAELLEHGIFYGAFANDQVLAAVAGTHIVSPAERIGTVGYVFTRPDQRGRGYATAATAAVTEQCFAIGIDLVTLNVRQDNPPAIHAYARIGYVIHNALFEGFATRRSAP